MRIAIFDQLQSFTPGLIAHWKRQGHLVGLYTEYDPMVVGRGVDLLFFDWLDKNIIVASQNKHPVPMICRLHSYEVFTDYPSMVNWENLDKLVFVSDYVRSFFFTIFNQVSVDSAVIVNGIDPEKWSFKVRSKSDKPKVAIIGEMSGRKGVQLLLEVIARWPNAEFHWAGPIGDPCFSTLWNDHIAKIGAQDRCYYTGFQNDVNGWLEDKDYILSGSPWESFGYSIVQAMAKGIKPLIYNFPGAQFMYPKISLWNTVDELFELVRGRYISESYRQYILEKEWTEKRQFAEFDALLAEVTSKEGVVVPA